MNFLEELLQEIKKIKDEHAREDAFNAYQIFRLNDKEVMHSRFIKALLNPNENHGYKDKFLILLLNQIGITNFSTNNITAECEKNTHNNRYIDIAIENKPTNQMIIIENKIWAGDLDNQLLDYHQFGMNLYKKSENIFMLYLTPYGRLPNDNSFPKIKEQPKNGIKCISYEKDIIAWLEDCLKLIGDKGRLYHCIEMYIELIRKTINRDKYMEEIIKTLLGKPNQMELAIDIAKALVGRNFLATNSISRVEILNNLAEALDGCEPTREEVANEDVFYHVDKLNITVTSEDIYAQNQADNKNAIAPLKINGYNLNDKYLVALLTNNQAMIQEWIKLTTNMLNGEAENQIE